MRVKVCKRFNFCYGHYLPNYDGDCANQHGHNSILEVEYIADIDKHTPATYPEMVMDFKDLKILVKNRIIDYLDHENLNDLPEFDREISPPTAENICQIIWQRLESEEFGDFLNRVRIYETPDSYAEIERGQ